MRRCLAFLAALVLAANIGAISASAGTPPLRLVPGQTVTIPLKGGGTITLTTTGNRRTPPGLVRNDPSSYIETTVNFNTGFGTPAATYKLHTDWYWDGTQIIQVSNYDQKSVVAPGYSWAWSNTSWRWVTYPTSAESRGNAELDSWAFIPGYGSVLVWSCQFHVLHNVDSWGGAYGTYTPDAGC